MARRHPIALHCARCALRARALQRYQENDLGCVALNRVALQNYLRYVVDAFTPIQMEQPIKEGSNIGRAERFFGVQPAPKYLIAPEQYQQQMKGVENAATKKKIRHGEREKALEGQ